MLESDGPGGAETVLLHLAEGLRARGHIVVPVLPGITKGKKWLRGQLKERGFEVELFHLPHALDLRCVPELMGIFRRRGVEVVHSHEFTMAVFGGLAARFAGLPCVITMHGGKGFAGRWRRRAALRWAIRHSRATVGVSGAAAEFLESSLGLPHGMVGVVENGIPVQTGRRDPVRAELGLSPGEPLIVSVGNLYPVKGHIVLLKALALLQASRPGQDWKAALAGRGEEEGRLRAFMAEHGLERRVTLLGFRPDVPDILAGGDIWVMPSLSEGLPISLLEAMFAGKAIVASRVGGIPEVARDEREALLSEAGDEVQLAAQLGRLLDDPERRRALGEAARMRAEEKYRLERTLDEYERLYRSGRSA